MLVCVCATSQSVVQHAASGSQEGVVRLLLSKRRKHHKCQGKAEAERGR
jgi:hypothetical protein